MGALWVAATAWVFWEIHKNVLKDPRKHWAPLAILTTTCLVGLLFLWKGKVRTTVFDRRCGTLTVKRRNLCCHKRSIVTYRLKDISDVRAVYRGHESGSVDTRTYMLIVEIPKHRFQDNRESSEDEDSYYSSTDEEFVHQKEKLRRKEQEEREAQETTIVDTKKQQESTVTKRKVTTGTT